MSIEQSSCILSEEKQNVYFLHSSIQTKKVEKYRKPDCRAVFRTLSNIYDGAFLQI